MDIKGNMRDCGGNRRMFCSHVTIFVVRCTTVLQDVTIRENLVKGMQDLSVLFLTTACESIIIQNFKFQLKIFFIARVKTTIQSQFT